MISMIALEVYLPSAVKDRDLVVKIFVKITEKKFTFFFFKLLNYLSHFFIFYLYLYI